jgi:hypothetical protein
MENPLTSTEVSACSPEEGSPLALAGLMWGVGVLDAVEVLRYLDATFRRHSSTEKGQAE